MGGDDAIAEYEKGNAPWCIMYTFMLAELEDLLRSYGVKNIHLSDPGVYARTIPNELLVKIMKDPRLGMDFLDFYHRYDLLTTKHLI